MRKKTPLQNLAEWSKIEVKRRIHEDEWADQATNGALQRMNGICYNEAGRVQPYPPLYEYEIAEIHNQCCRHGDLKKSLRTAARSIWSSSISTPVTSWLRWDWPIAGKHY